MKKFLVLGSLAAALLVTGCSNKSSVESNANNMQSGKYYTSDGSGYDYNRDNFVNLEERIGYVEDGLRNVFFNFDQFTVRPDMQPVVERDARILTSISAGTLNVRVEGNTDEWGTDEYNYALGLKRAVAVKNALVAQGVDESKTILVSYGESKPTCTAKTRECWAENRKVTFKMLP